MQPFNVEIFDRDFNFIHNYTIESIEYHEDYLALPETVVFMSFNENVKRGNYITVYNDEERFSGIITSVTASAKYGGFMNVGFKSLIAVFRASFRLFVNKGTDITTYAQTHSLESFISQYITQIYVNGRYPNYEVDDELKIPGLSVTTISNTLNWNLGLVSDMEYDSDGATMISMIDDLIMPAMEKYKIALYIDFNFKAKTISIQIGIKNNNPITIEADLPNVLNVTYNTKDYKDDVNTVYTKCNTSDWNVDPVFDDPLWYKHSDGTWSQDPTGRILPPVYAELYYNSNVEAYNPNVGTPPRVGGQDFMQMLVQEFGGTNDDNCIELTVANSDPLATMFKLGDAVNIIINDTIYTSIYTGKDKTNVTKLIFGTIRLDLTKILKRRI